MMGHGGHCHCTCRGQQGCSARSFRCATALIVVLCVITWVSASSRGGEDCNSGILQLVPPSPSYDAPLDRCMSIINQADSLGPKWFDMADRNTIKARCGVAFKVVVTRGVVRMVPLEMRTFRYNGPYPETGQGPPPMNCKDMNASGLLYPGSTTHASVMLFDDTYGPLSNLTKTGPNRVSLFAAVNHLSYGESRSPIRIPHCVFNYTVVSGCVLGARPASAAAILCLPGHVSKVGRFGIKYCAACPPGTFAKGGAGSKCITCPVGTAGDRVGLGKCKPCSAPAEYGPTPGAANCKLCSGNAWKNPYEDNSKCNTCPADSTPDGPRCVRCYAGQRCCTVNADRYCPWCSTRDKPPTYWSVFALESAMPASCLATLYAQCAPQIGIQLDGTCKIYVSSSNHISGCSPWATYLPIRGPGVITERDLKELGRYYAAPQRGVNSDANITVSGPYLDIAVPQGAARCTYRYRALTKPAAALLRVVPRPAPAGRCPAGKYRDTTTDTSPGPCLPCHPGTYAAKAGTTGGCTPCAPGTFTNRLGSTACTKCVDSISAKGATTCHVCDAGTYTRDGRTCVRCPQNTGSYYSGTGSCLANNQGSICCAAGRCGGQTRCGAVIAKGRATGPFKGAGGFQSMFQLKSLSVKAASCRRALSLSCLAVGTKLLAQVSHDQLQVTLRPNSVADCRTLGRPVAFTGGIAGANRAILLSGRFYGDPTERYEVVTNRTTRTFNLYLSKDEGNNLLGPTPMVGPAPDARKECMATFQLLDGAFLDLKPSKPSGCLPDGRPAPASGSKRYCTACFGGRVRNSATGACQPCPRGTYQPQLDSPSCQPCPPGFLCPVGTARPEPCLPGTYNPSRSAAQCKQCPAGSVSGYGAASCTKCSAGTKARARASTCAVPWATKF